MSRLATLLVQEGLCTPEQLQEAVQNQVILGGRLGTNLVETGVLSEGQLAQYLGRIFRVPAAWGKQLQPDPACVALLEARVAARLNVVPYGFQDRRLLVLCEDPGNLPVLDEVAARTRCPVAPVVVPELRLGWLLNRCYGVARGMRCLTMDVPPPPVPPDPVSAPADVPPPPEDLMSEDDFRATYRRQHGEPLPLGEELPLLTGTEFPEDPPLLTGTILLEEPPPPESALDFPEAAALLQQATTRDEIARTVLRYARSLFSRALLFTVHKDWVAGWDAVGEGLDRARFRQVVLPLGPPSVFKLVVDTRAHVLGALRKEPWNIKFLRAVGKKVPLSAVALPILVRGRVVNVFYGDNGHRQHCTSDLGQLQVLALRISQSYEAMVRAKLAR